MAPPKIILQLYPTMPTVDEDDRIAKRPIGRNRELYNEIIHEWVEILQEAEEMGVWGAATIEHHFHSEGYEVGPNPGVLNAWWAGYLKKMHVGAMGYVMAAQDPIRVAEETAIIDHITKGRYFVGLARGYQRRWTNVLGQFTNTPAALSDGSAEDQKNRDVFEERVEMLLDCWKNESVRLDGQYYQAPYPLATGVEGYHANAITAKAGAHGEVDANGAIQRICVVPAPYQYPHPPIFVASNKSDDSIRYCAKNGFIPTYFSAFDTVARQSEIYVEEAQKHGRQFVRGQRQNIVRWIHICDSEEEYDEQLRKYEVDIFKNFYSPFFPHFVAEQGMDWVDAIKKSGIYVGGTVEKVRKELQATFDVVPAEYVTLVFHWAQVPRAVMLRTISRFMTEIVPTLECPEFVAIAAE
jgi:alkanesulfonate monooxygenase SsuD/methylene tetrahydromethanopterin reductase-like flavin-dependent oxidoreductase (luciferase family)